MPKEGAESIENIPLTHEDAPFFRRMENGQYVPVPATCSDARINSFRNVGRMMGLCLQQRLGLPHLFTNFKKHCVSVKFFLFNLLGIF